MKAETGAIRVVDMGWPCCTWCASTHAAVIFRSQIGGVRNCPGLGLTCMAFSC